MCEQVTVKTAKELGTAMMVQLNNVLAIARPKPVDRAEENPWDRAGQDFRYAHIVLLS